MFGTSKFLMKVESQCEEAQGRNRSTQCSGDVSGVYQRSFLTVVVILLILLTDVYLKQDICGHEALAMRFHCQTKTYQC